MTTTQTTPFQAAFIKAGYGRDGACFVLTDHSSGKPEYVGTIPVPKKSGNEGVDNDRWANIKAAVEDFETTGIAPGFVLGA